LEAEARCPPVELGVAYRGWGEETRRIARPPGPDRDGGAGCESGPTDAPRLRPLI